MKVYSYTIFTACLVSILIVGCSKSKQEVLSGSQLVNPFIGVDGGGNAFPGACLPFSVMSISPDSKNWQGTSGYHCKQPIIGFSHTHTSGTGGIGRYGNFLVYPQKGTFNLESAFSKLKNEKASPGYYSASLVKEDVDAQLSMLNEHCGLHEYSFKQSDMATIQLAVSSTRQTNASYSPNSRCTFAEARITGPNSIQGCASFKGGWGGHNPYKIYFVAEFDHPFDEFGFWTDSGLVKNTKELKLDLTANPDSVHLGVFMQFAQKDNSVPIKMKIAIAYTGYEKAMEYFKVNEEWDINSAKEMAERKWNNYLNRIQVKGGTKEQQTLLYTGLYHSAIMPRDLSGDNPCWDSYEPHYWDYYCLWDTYRSVNPLYMLIAPERQSDMIRCLLDIYKHKGWLPDAWIAGDYGLVQGGSNADVVISEAIQKKIPGFDYQLAYEAIQKNSEVNSDRPKKYGRFLTDYNSIGYVPATDAPNKPNWPWCPTSRTEEYAYNDFCIAKVAKALEKNEDYRKYLDKSLNVFNLFDTSTKFFWGKDRQGKWATDFDPAYRPYYWHGYYYEGSPYHYSTYSPHHMEKLIDLHGGQEKFIAFLDTIFNGGYYEASNQPDIHTPWLYHYAGRPDKSTDRLWEIIDKEYKNENDGLPGNDDAGTMSAWYVFASMGFYPVPGQDIYLITSPIFDESRIKVWNQNYLEIKAEDLSEQNKYIQTVVYNGKTLNRSWLRHDEIIEGGVLILKMGNKPSSWGTDDLPPSFDKI